MLSTDDNIQCIFSNSELNKIFKEIYYKDIDYTKVFAIDINKAVFAQNKYYVAIYIRAEKSYILIEKFFETQEEAESYANSLNFVIDSNDKSYILNISEVPIGFNRYETKILHPLTLEYSPFIAQHYSIETERKERIDDITNEQE